MPDIFGPVHINKLELRNRFVRSATWEGMAAPDGACTPEVIKVLAELARGGVGLIISSHAFVSPEGRATGRQLGIFEDRLAKTLEPLAAAVHKEHGRIALQLAHAGIFAFTKETGEPALAASAVEGFTKGPVREAGKEDIARLVDAFSAAALRARDAGFDAVQVHAAHGYLLNQFLSPTFNRRADEYGGPIENRARCLLEIIAAIRKNLGRDFPLLVKLNSRDDVENGLSLEDSIKVGKLLAPAGVDAIELSGGTIISGKLSPSRTKIDAPEREAYFRDAAQAFKKEVPLPLILVGGIRSFATAHALIKNGTADFVSMSRAFICEPGLVKRWKSGDLRPSECVSDNRCFGPAMAGRGINCETKRPPKE
jgi:2,4-dienoyl-CoA reductase-like NADH-dependent reductase (Old Yellow Enzyme family)